MSSGVDYLSDELDRAVKYCRQEFDMSYAEVVGVLMISAHLLIAEASDDEDG